MTNRLLSIANKITNGVGVIDVGTDHGYIPLWLAQNGYSGSIIASDINRGPIKSAMCAAHEAGFSERIEFSLCDGLEGCNKESIDTIVIAGMGGDTICGILDRAEWCVSERYKLVLQPMTKAEVLRYWLINNEFTIVDEDLAKDGDNIYQIVSARFGAYSHLSDAELYTGDLNMVHSHMLFPQYRQRLIHRFETALQCMMLSSCRKPAKEKLLSDILNSLKEMNADDN